MTKIEQIAAAMALATNGGKWDDGHYCEDHKALWMKRAAAAIEALRKPTREMVNAAWYIPEHNLRGPLVRESSTWPAGDDDKLSDDTAYEVWQAMIDAALQEKPE